MSIVYSRIALFARRFVWIWAALWLLLLAVQIFDATFQLQLVRLFTSSLRLPALVVVWLEWLKEATWSVVPLFVFFVIREEARRWLNDHAKSRVADRLMVAWFVFVTTLFTLDMCATEIRIRWPLGAIDATLWLTVLRLSTWMSQRLHAKRNRRPSSVARRRRVNHWLKKLTGPLSAALFNGRRSHEVLQRTLGTQSRTR